MTEDVSEMKVAYDAAKLLQRTYPKKNFTALLLDLFQLLEIGPCLDLCLGKLGRLDEGISTISASAGNIAFGGHVG